MNKKRRERKRRRIRIIMIFLIIIAILLLAFLALIIGKRVYIRLFGGDPIEEAQNAEIPDWIDVQLIDELNPSRSGVMLDGINDIVVHYVGNPRTTAQQNRDYYNNLDSNVSSHFVVGIDGEIIMCLPLYERSAASNDRNHDTISIEVCHPDETGEFTDASYQSLIKLVNWLLEEFDLTSDNVIRHYDITGKECPIYYVRNPQAWEAFKDSLEQ
ncbi:MAG: N-acetylmuramoyl-L-alanine amidase [Lachnospiraceae bacterium]|nr:N-acetylmuramoyl-L-alanine amidase [Lachnospiraceae bacterium]